MQFFETLLRQEQTTQFEYSPISNDIVQQLLASAQLAPFDGEVQPYEFVVLRRRELLGQAANVVNWPEIKNCGALFVVLVDLEGSSQPTADATVAAHQLSLAAISLGMGVARKTKGIQKLREVITLPKENELQIASAVAIGKAVVSCPPHRGKSLSDLAHEDVFGRRFVF
jgi:nitroreductase